MKYIIVLLTTIMISNLSFAACNQPVTYLQEGSPAPCNGYIFTIDKELEVRLKVAGYDKLVELTKKQDELSDIQDKRIQNQIEQNILLSNELNNRKDSELWKILGAFGLGAILTGIIASNVSK